MLAQLSVAKKIYLLVALALVGVLVVGFVGWQVQRELSGAATEIGEVHLPAVRNMTLADMMHDGLRAVAFRALIASERNNADELKASKEELEEFSADFKKYIGEVDQLPISAETHAAIDKVRPDLEAYLQATAQIVGACVENHRETALADLPNFQALFEKLEGSMDDLGKRIESESHAALEDTRNVVQVSNQISWVAVAVAAVVALLFGTFLARRVVVPLRNAVLVLESGDMSRLSGVKSTDEIGQMARAIEKTVTAMESSSRAVAEQKQAIEANAEQLAASSRQLAEQKRALEVSSAEAARVASMVENAPACMMYADRELVLRYLNPAAKRKLPLLVPGMRHADGVGEALDSFFRHPQGNAQFFAQRGNLPFHTRFELGSDTIDLLVAAVNDARGEWMGMLLSWEVVTQAIEAQRKIEEAQARELAHAEELKSKVDQLLGVVDRAARGDLTAEVTIRGEDAVGRIGGGLARLISDLRKSVTHIRESAERLASSSETLNNVSRSMSNEAVSTSTQATLVGSVSTQLSHNVQTVAAGTEQMANSIQEISRSATDAAVVARRAVTVADETNAAVARLGQSSEEIGKILKVITSIAQQTNLLALNATIEAARAGEAGKGFAVVANEVKELAKETAKATEDIRTKIDAIQRDTQGAVGAITQIGEIISQIDALQTSIAGAVEEQHATTQQITQTLNEAAKGSNQIVTSISQVAGSAQNTSKGASNAEEVATGVSKTAVELLELVGQFRC